MMLSGEQQHEHQRFQEHLGFDLKEMVEGPCRKAWRIDKPIKMPKTALPGVPVNCRAFGCPHGEGGRA